MKNIISHYRPSIEELFNHPSLRTTIPKSLPIPNQFNLGGQVNLPVTQILPPKQLNLSDPIFNETTKSSEIASFFKKHWLAISLISGVIIFAIIQHQNEEKQKEKEQNAIT